MTLDPPLAYAARSRVAETDTTNLATPEMPGLRVYSRSRMPTPEVVLSRPLRQAVESAIRRHCAIRDWTLLALNVRTNHVHVAVTAQDAVPEVVAGQCKAWATRRLRDDGLVAPDARIWARHASTVVLFDEEAVGEVIDYILFRQGEPLT